MTQMILGAGGAIGVPLAKELNTEAKIQHVPKWMVQILGIFMPEMREFPEMLYQYEQDYIFDSSKFETKFGITSTTPEEGLKKMMESVISKTAEAGQKP